jgi:hypothetical protein
MPSAQIWRLGHTGRVFRAFNVEAAQRSVTPQVAGARFDLRRWVVFRFGDHRALSDNLEVAILPSFEEYQTDAEMPSWPRGSPVTLMKPPNP